jgi:hypothetical protein
MLKLLAVFFIVFVPDALVLALVSLFVPLEVIAKIVGIFVAGVFVYALSCDIRRSWGRPPRPARDFDEVVVSS